MEHTTLHKLGIDIGSTTVKIAILSEDNELLFSDYERHFANIQETLSSLLQKAYDALGDMTLAPMLRRQTLRSSLAVRMQRSFILKAVMSSSV